MQQTPSDDLSYAGAIIHNSEALNIIIAGNFNCSNDTRFFSEFSTFVNESDLTISHMSRLSNVPTYISDDGIRRTWIDHIGYLQVVLLIS